ncbi:urease accessory protein UreD [Streptomyces sp. NPDC018031]|uniref:urease accessory protein UreD n=1 Tax=Streptomyces sp. NPDC018031 TaxID=3365033 RepID=UPI003787A2FF
MTRATRPVPRPGGTRPAPGAGAAAGPAPSGVLAAARISAVPDGRGGTALAELDGQGPLALRRLATRGPEARVALVGAMSAPLGGDRLGLTAELADGARLRFSTTAATIALPGRTGAPAHYDTSITVGEHAELAWLPEPLISAHGSDLRMHTRITLAATARLTFREEQVLGRAGEGPGSLATRLTVYRSGVPLLDQESAYGPRAPGWDGPAVLGGHRAVGQLLVVDPAFADRPPRLPRLGDTAVATPLAGPAVLVTAVAADALRLRRLFDDASDLTGW